MYSKLDDTHRYLIKKIKKINETQKITRLLITPGPELSVP